MLRTFAYISEMFCACNSSWVITLDAQKNIPLNFFLINLYRNLDFSLIFIFHCLCGTLLCGAIVKNFNKALKIVYEK